jgi:hypothetical protein
LPMPASMRTSSCFAIAPATACCWSIIDGGMKETFFRSELDKSPKRRCRRSVGEREADCD